MNIAQRRSARHAALSGASLASVRTKDKEVTKALAAKGLPAKAKKVKVKT